MDRYKIEVLSEDGKLSYIKNAINAIENIRAKITELNNNITNNVAMPSMPEPYMVTFYIKDVIGISNRQSQEDNENGIAGESYYYEFIPTNNTNILVELRITDHKRDETWSDRMDNGTHANVRATTFVTKSVRKAPTAKKSPAHKVNKVKIRRIIQELSPVVYGTPQQAIQHLNTLIPLFEYGRFGKFKNKSVKSKDRVPQNISIDKHGNWSYANGWGADYVSESKDIYGNNNIKTENYMRNNKRTIRLTESDLHRVIKESVKRVLREGQVENNKPYFGKVSYLDDPKGHIDGYLQPGEFDYNQSLDRDAIRHMPHFKNGRNENGWLDDESMEQLNNYRQAFDKHQERSLQKMQPQPSLKDRIQAKKDAKRQEDEAFQEFVYRRTRGLIPSDLSEEEYIDLWREFAREY